MQRGHDEWGMRLPAFPGSGSMLRRILTYLGLMLGVLAFAGLFAVIFGNSIELTCLRAGTERPTCRITRALLGRVPLSSRTMVGVTGVELERDCDDSCSYRAILVASNGDRVAVNFVGTDDFDGVQRQVDGISGFLASSDASYHLEVPVAWWVLWLVGGLSAIGAAVLVGNFLAQSLQR
jgi:hypothetical protein